MGTPPFLLKGEKNMSKELRRFQNRRGTAADLAAKNEVPLAGEMIIETDTGKIKIGDGVKAYNSLEYLDKQLGLEVETWTFVLDDDEETRIDKKVALWS